MTIGRKTKQALDQEFVKSKPVTSLTPGQILTILRKKNELSQSELAKAAKMAQSTISSLESDRIKLGVERARALAKVLHVHPAVLLFPDWNESELAA
jgi:transcriptional regulator with XRE-family HTH domain